MDSDNTNLEERLKSLLSQQRTESGILERIVHNGKNQHRRSPYFQALLKVRRDLRLLQSAELGQILYTLFPIIKGTGPVEDTRHSNLSKKKYPSRKCNYHLRLLGVARLLSQMVEPILKAAIQISLLLAKTFFMGFSLTVLACLARLRVLIQQMLLDVVSVFNKVSAHSEKHSLKLSHEGIEAFVEYYSDIQTLECIWEEDKFVLHEKSTQIDRTKKQEELGAFPLEAPIKYQTLEFFGQGSCLENENFKLKEAPCLDVQPPLSSSVDQSAATDISIKSIDCKSESACNPSADKDSSQSMRVISSQSESRKRVAFVAVQFSKPSELEPNQPEKKMRLNSPFSRNSATVAADPLPDFSLGGCLNRTLF